MAAYLYYSSDDICRHCCRSRARGEQKLSERERAFKFLTAHRRLPEMGCSLAVLGCYYIIGKLAETAALFKLSMVPVCSSLLFRRIIMLYMHINYESHEQKAVRKKYITLNAHVFVNRARSCGTIIDEDHHRTRRRAAFQCFDP